jgi:hypothetical protein
VLFTLQNKLMAAKKHSVGGRPLTKDEMTAVRADAKVARDALTPFEYNAINSSRKAKQTQGQRDLALVHVQAGSDGVVAPYQQHFMTGNASLPLSVQHIQKFYVANGFPTDDRVFHCSECVVTQDDVLRPEQLKGLRQQA